MSTEFVSFNEIFLPVTGGDIEGSLDVNGLLTVNDKSGNGTAYDVAAEIAELKSAWDSISPSTPVSFDLGKFWRIGRLGIADIDYVCTESLTAWGIIAQAKLPNNISSMTPVKARLNVEAYGDSSADVYVNGDNIYLRNRDSSAYTVSGNGFGITGQIVFPIA